MFPTAAAVWKRYVDLEVEAGNHDGVRSIFGRCLLPNRCSELWSAYTRFVKSNTAATAAGIQEVAAVYAFAADNIGNDINSGPIWQARSIAFGGVFVRAFVFALAACRYDA